MRPLQQDLSVFNKFDFEKPPVGIKFQMNKPEGIEQVDKCIPFCEMLKEAHEREKPFYFCKENEACFGKFPLGMEDMTPFSETGQISIELETYQEPRAASRLYQYLPKLGRGHVNYVVYSRLSELTFEPDLLMLTATPSQAETVLRAMSYSTGEIWESKVSLVIACAWLYVYPYKSGKVNYTATGLSFGMKVWKVFPEGLTLISIPWDWIPTITQNLQEMNWVPASYTDTREEFVERWKRALPESP